MRKILILTILMSSTAFAGFRSMDNQSHLEAFKGKLVIHGEFARGLYDEMPVMSESYHNGERHGRYSKRTNGIMKCFRYDEPVEFDDANITLQYGCNITYKPLDFNL